VRYLIDAALIVFRLYNDKDTLNILRSLGNLIPNVSTGHTQIDGLHLPSDINIPSFGDDPEKVNLNKLGFLFDLCRKPLSSNRSCQKKVPRILDCNWLELKCRLKAKYVAQRPKTLSPLKEHREQIIHSLVGACNESAFAIAPQSATLLLLGSLQPNAIFVQRLNSTTWRAMAKEVEVELYKAIAFYPETADLEALERFILLANNMADELKVVEGRASVHKKPVDLSGAKPIELKGMSNLGESNLHKRTDVSIPKRKKRKKKKDKKTSQFHQTLVSPIGGADQVDRRIHKSMLITDDEE
jgi:hypothetical protein